MNVQMILDAENRRIKLFNPITDKRKPAYENDMCRSVGMMMTCNSCDRIIWEHENWVQGYIDSHGYCPECANEISNY